MDLSLVELNRRLTSAGVNVLADEPMSRRCSFQTGGPADLFALPDSAEGLALCLCMARELGVHHIVVGKGSNLLVSDKGVRGLVVCTSAMCGGMEIRDETTVEVQAGERLSALAKFCEANGLSGMEFASGIPGSVGGAVFMNAGAYGGEIKDGLQNCRLLDGGGGVIMMTKAELELGYRSSILQRNGFIALSASFTLAKGRKEDISAKTAELNAKRKLSQPLDFPSAGSTFKRPPERPNGPVYAAKLIQGSGLSGHMIGGAQVSELHRGFIINKHRASSADIYMLIHYVMDIVLREQGVLLEPEVRFVGEF